MMLLGFTFIFALITDFSPVFVNIKNYVRKRANADMFIVENANILCPAVKALLVENTVIHVAHKTCPLFLELPHVVAAYQSAVLSAVLAQNLSLGAIDVDIFRLQLHGHVSYQKPERKIVANPCQLEGWLEWEEADETPIIDFKTPISGFVVNVIPKHNKVFWHYHNEEVVPL